ncbi:MAG TPA: VOC family protein [Caulobacteraceae bacterium]|jgi:catechol 2,3-dioxygenase-like lactoylglutathione lyase family enzyme
MARFNQINLIVRDMDATLAFYRRLGVELPEDAVWRTESGAHHANVDATADFGVDFDSHALAERYNRGFRAEQGRVLIGVELESREAVDALWEALLAESVQGLQPPYDAFWGRRYAIVEDPDGNPVGLSSPRDAALGGPPPAI